VLAASTTIALMLEAESTSEKSANFYATTRRSISLKCQQQICICNNRKSSGIKKGKERIWKTCLPLTTK
jgi:hypothetical protein